jgi:hypothetical protein
MMSSSKATSLVVDEPEVNESRGGVGIECSTGSQARENWDVENARRLHAFIRLVVHNGLECDLFWES